MKLTPALCLDLDGTVRRCKSGKPFIESLDDIELMPGIEKILWRYREMGWFIVGISNQGGVAHGFKDRDDVMREVDVTMKLFNGSPFKVRGPFGHRIQKHPFDMVKCCLHDASGMVEPYNHRSLCRKPEIGMLAVIEVDAFEQGYIIDWDKSILVGDRYEDHLCADNAKITFRHIDSFLNEPHVFDIPTHVVFDQPSQPGWKA